MSLKKNMDRPRVIKTELLLIAYILLLLLTMIKTISRR